MTKVHKQYRLRTIKNPDGEIKWTIEMHPDFIEPIKDEKIYVPCARARADKTKRA
jgi:hypothetical protein